MQADDKEMNLDAGTFFCHFLDSVGFAVLLDKPSAVARDHGKGPSRNFKIFFMSSCPVWAIIKIFPNSPVVAGA